MAEYDHVDGPLMARKASKMMGNSCGVFSWWVFYKTSLINKVAIAIASYVWNIYLHLVEVYGKCR